MKRAFQFVAAVVLWIVIDLTHLGELVKRFRQANGE